MHVHTISNYAPLSEWQAFAVANPDIQTIDAFIIDVNGHALGKRLPVSDAATLFNDGVQFSACAFIADCRGLGHDAGGLGKSDGDPDGVAKPITGTVVRVPWATIPTAQVQCHMVDVLKQQDLWIDPRVLLRNVVQQCRTAGIYPVVACELEFYLIDPRRDIDGRISVGALPQRTAPRRAANLSLDAVDENSPFLSAVMAAAAAQNIPVCGCVAEYGLGQHEINLRHLADPVLAADQAVLLKRLIRGVARRFEVEATFMAKPFAEQPGSGLHVHVSLIDERGDNRFGAPGGEALLKQAVAGMQALMYDSVGFFAPNFNSHRRYLGPFVPTSLAWGSNNRSVAFRLPVGHGQARRVEHRVAGADASPHLTVAALLAAVLHGVTHKLVPTAPVEGRASHNEDSEFPGDLMMALARLETSATLAKYFPAKYLQAYAALKRGEYHALLDSVFGREHDFYA